MRKRSASEIVKGNTSHGQGNKSVPYDRAKFGKVQQNNRRIKGKKHIRKKSCVIINQINIPTTSSDDSLIVNDKYSNNLFSSEEIGMVGSLRRTTSVPNSGGEENISSRRRTVTGSGDNDSKLKQEPLPDILHDWEIIVKSLRETSENETDNTGGAIEITVPNTKVPKTPNLKLTHPLRLEHTDSDKENSLLKKKNTTSGGKVLEFLSPSTSGGKTKFSKACKSSPVHLPKPIKSQTDSPPKQIKSPETSPHDDSDATWRRPTRSTYKAFENVFESPELVIPLESEFNDSDKKEILAIKEILTTPKKLTDRPSEKVNETITKRQKWKLKRLPKSPLRKLRNKILSGSLNKGSSIIKVKQNRGRPRKLLKNSLNILKGNVNDRKLLKIRQLKRDFTKRKRPVVTSNSILDKVSNVSSNSACRELYVKIENLKIPDREMDFIGFGSPEKKTRIKPTLKYELPKEEIIEEESLRDEVCNSPSFSNDEEMEVESNPDTTIVEKQSPSKLLSIKAITENNLNVSNNSLTSLCRKTTIELSEFESYFGIEEKSLVPDFEGFPSSISGTKKRTCLSCSLVLQSSKALKQHMKAGHRRIYACPFDLGQCGQWKGAINLHKHMMCSHASLVSYLNMHLNSDLRSGKIANWMPGSEGCAVCLMPIEQPDRCIHEMIIHGVWPPSLLNFSSVSIDQHVSLWWTSRTLAFACHLCHTPQSASSRNCTIPIVRTAPHCFPTLLSNHLRNVHLVNLPLLQGWYLTIKLLLSLPAAARRTLATTIILGVDTKVSYSMCIVCNVPLSFYSNINLHFSHGLCNKCEVICRFEKQCWFNCSNFVPHENNAVNHIISEHKNISLGAWCISCGEWNSNIIMHTIICSNDKIINCKFCSLKIIGLSVLKKVWHSLFCHIFPCPIPNCTNSGNFSMQQQCFPSAVDLFKHLLCQHFPEWVGFSLDQLSSLIINSKKTHGIVLTKFSAQHLNGIWIGLSGHRYSLSSGVLTPVDTTKVPMVCLLCSHKWEESFDFGSKEKSAVCPECTLLVSQCEYGDLTSQCPVYRCFESISTISELYQHLVQVHKLSSTFCNSKCLHCAIVNPSKLSSVTHGLLKHKIACLVCPFVATTTLKLHNHHATVHGLPTWEAVFQHLKLEEFSRNKGKEKSNVLHGVIRIWVGDQGTEAQWDSSLTLSELLADNEERDYGGVINQPIQENFSLTSDSTSQDLNEVDSWCSSLCTVSMSSPSKPYGEFISPDKDIKPDIGHIQNKIESLNEAEHGPSNILIPTVSVDENGEDSDAPSCNSPVKDRDDKEQTSNNLKVFFDQDSESDSSDGNNSTGSTFDRPLKIDSSVHSPESHSAEDKLTAHDAKPNNSLSVTIPININSTERPIENNVSKSSILNSVKEGKAVPIKKNDTKTPTFGLVDTLNSVMEETLQSMSKALSVSLGNKDNEISKISSPISSKRNKVEHTKGLGENAFIDESVMAENILKDLEEKYSGTCVDCGNSILLPDLKIHIKSFHPGKSIYCSCGFRGELYATLVHSFHMSHLPNEARPIILRSEDAENCLMIVLEARPDLKTVTYPCYKCSKRFKQEKSRQLHYNLCKLEKKFFCDVCGEKFALDNHLQKHKEWKHNPQICKHCGKTFNSSSSLAQHVLHIHKKPLSQRCRQCGDAFNTSKQLKVHLRIHSGNQPHICQHCPQKFISRNLLLKHTMKLHKEFLSEKDKAKQYKLNGAPSSSTDSSDSDDSDAEPRIKLKRRLPNDNEIKVMALTESDLNTSSSDIEEMSSPYQPMKRARMVNSKKTVISVPTKFEKEQELKSKSAGIYQDREAVALPEMKGNIKAKVDASVGRVCVPCGQEFDSPTAKLLHMYLIHPGVVLTLGFSECSFCEHKFLSADDVSNHHLDKHQRTPLSNGNFRCLCGLVFREDGAYYFHLYYAHKAQRALNIGGEIVCRLCEGRPRLNKIVDLVVHLSDRHTMFDHVRFNDSYMCNFCYKAFESWTVLSLHFFMVHKATKSQTLSYDCPYCQGASPWHSLEALQYHLDNVHRGRHTQSRPVPEHSRNIYTPAPAPSSPTKKKEPSTPSVKPLQVKNLRMKSLSAKKSPQKSSKKQSKTKPKKMPDLYCICQSPYDEASDMIGCDSANCKFQWFHFECVGINAVPDGNWYCPDCTNISNQKQKQVQKQSQLQADLYEYYSNYSNDATEVQTSIATTATGVRTRQHSTSSNSSNSSNSSSSSSSNSSSSSSSSSGESSSASGDEN